MERNFYVIADIHGMLNKLKNLLEKIQPTNKDTLVFLGDYIDRGPDSFELIEFLINLKNKFDCIFLQGNHESMLYEYMVGCGAVAYLSNGGGETIESYKRNGFDISDSIESSERGIPESHANFFDELSMLYETPGYIFVHAGIKLIYENDTYKCADSSKQDENSLLWSREFHRFGRCVYKGPKTVIFGHTPWDDVRITDFAVCIDTGACYPQSGKLTCIRLPDKKIFQAE